MAHRAKTKKLTRRAAFSEVKRNEPAIVSKTRRKSGKEAARKQKVAIALSKAGLSKRRKSMLRGSPFAAVFIFLTLPFLVSCANLGSPNIVINKNIVFHGVDSDDITVEYHTESGQNAESDGEIDIAPELDIPIPIP